MNTTAIVTVVGPDRVGIIAEICRTLADLDLNVLEISQTIMSGMFTMIMRVELPDTGVDMGALQEAFDAAGQPLGMVVRIQSEALFSAINDI